jgi:hypothetical protein
MIGWYHEECHILIFEDPSNFGKHIKKKVLVILKEKH